jgi:hypothetical protein
VAAGLVAAAALAAAVGGCGSHKTSSPAQSGTTSGAASSPSASLAPAPSSAPPTDYSGLLIQATDIDAPVQFSAGPPTPNPNGQPGVATTFSTQDGSHVIKDTIQVLADPSAATNALNAAKGAQGEVVKNPTTEAVKVGADGTSLSGNSPDRSKGITVLLFTEGKAFVTLEFNGPADTLAPPEFVNDVAQKQDAAVKKGLGG